jgi:hypothetical protein
LGALFVLRQLPGSPDRKELFHGQIDAEGQRDSGAFHKILAKWKSEMSEMSKVQRYSKHYSYLLLSSSDPHQLTIYLTFYLTYIPTFYLTVYLAFYLAFYLVVYLALYLTYVLTVFLSARHCGRVFGFEAERAELAIAGRWGNSVPQFVAIGGCKK